MDKTIDSHRIFVLTDDENRVIAVINAPADLEELKAKLCLAITEDTNYQEVKIRTDIEFNDDTFMLEFEAEYEDEGEEEERTWYLEKTALY